MPRVSIILPTYNRADTLSRSISSVLAQTYQDFELIVIDDASEDETSSVVEGFNDERIRYTRLACNVGVAGARNQGIKSARGEWLAFQDSDDEWLPDKLALQMQAVDNSGGNIDLVLGSYLVPDAGNDLIIRPISTLEGNSFLPDLLDGWPIITPTWLVRKTCITGMNGFDESYSCLEDWDLVLRLSDHCRIAAVGNAVLIKYGSVDSVCADQQRLCTALACILDTHGYRWRDYPFRYARRLAHLGVLKYRLGKPGQAREAFRQARRQVPFRVEPVLLILASYLGNRGVSLVNRLYPRFATMTPSIDCMQTVSSHKQKP